MFWPVLCVRNSLVQLCQSTRLTTETTALEHNYGRYRGYSLATVADVVGSMFEGRTVLAANAMPKFRLEGMFAKNHSKKRL